MYHPHYRLEKLIGYREPDKLNVTLSLKSHCVVNITKDITRLTKGADIITYYLSPFFSIKIIQGRKQMIYHNIQFKNENTQGRNLYK